MAEATERWSDRKLTKAVENQWTASRGFDIVDADSETEALSAVIVGTALNVPNRNDPHPDQSRLKVRSVEAARVGFGIYKLSVAYAIPQGAGGGGDEFPDGEDDPLDEPNTFDWVLGNESVQFDRDIDDNPILNSALDPFVKLPTRYRGTIGCIIRRWEPFFDVQLPLTYKNTVNSNTFTVGGLGVIQAGQAFCEAITPTDTYKSDAALLKIEYRFKFDQLGFQLKAIDQGPQSYSFFVTTQLTSKGQIFTLDGEKASKDVLLNGRGGLVNKTGFLVGTRAQTDLVTTSDRFVGEENPSLPLGATIEAIDGGETAFTIGYKIYEEKDFSELNL